MKKTDKSALVQDLSEKINEYSHFYVTNSLGLNAASTSQLRRACFDKDIKMVMVKNTLFKRALQASDKEIDGIEKVLNGTSAVLFSNTGNAPAKLIKDFQKKTGEKLTFTPLFIQAVTKAIRDFPMINSSLASLSKSSAKKRVSEWLIPIPLISPLPLFRYNHCQVVPL